MKKTKVINIFKTSLIALCLMGLTGCDKYLDVNPDMRTEIDNVDKLSQLLVSAYPDRNYFTFAETASDNAEDKSAALAGHNDEPFVSLYHWNETLQTGNGTPSEYWDACYKAIAAADQALQSIEENDFDADKARQYKGEALVARAYSAFMLSVFFAEPYEIGGSNNGMGIPYPLEPETSARPQYERGTIKDVYAQIEKDLNEGIPLLMGATFKVPSFHFTEQAAHAFATRFYLFKGDWDMVIQHANQIYSDGNFKNKIRQYTGELYNLSHSEHKVEYTKAEKPWNLLLANTYSVYQRSSGAGNARYSFGENVKNFFTGNTPFGAAFRNRYGVYTAPNYTTNKFNEYFHYTNVQAGIGYPYIMAPIITADEALLNRAEAYIQKHDYVNAIRDLDDFASSRIVGYSKNTHGLTIDKAKAFFEGTDDKQALLNTLLHTKRIAFMQEGIRWMDILRHKIPVVHNHIDTDGTETFTTLEADDNRRVFQIPKDAMDAGITPNSR